MKQATYIDVQFKGNGLVPEQLAKQLNLPLTVLMSSGAIAPIGRYKGQESPYGIGVYQIKFNYDDLIQLIDYLYEQRHELNSCFVDTIIFDIPGTETLQNQFVFNAMYLNKMKHLKASIVWQSSLINAAESVFG
ncbi:MAG: hypothetical protein ACR2IL_08370 [Chitinophagaceae bacterium]